MLNEQVAIGIYHLLTLNPQRERILLQLGQLAHRIFTKGTQDPIPPEGLARVLPASTNDPLVSFDPNSSSSAAKVNKAYDRWNRIWAILIANSSVFFQVSIHYTISHLLLAFRTRFLISIDSCY